MYLNPHNYIIFRDMVIVYTPVDDREDKSGNVDPWIWHQRLDFISPKVLPVEIVGVQMY